MTRFNKTPFLISFTGHQETEGIQNGQHFIFNPVGKADIVSGIIPEINPPVCGRSGVSLGRPSQVEKIDGDGNCLFRAISYSLFSRQKYHGIVRSQMIEYMKDLPDEEREILLPQPKQSMETYIQSSQMSQSGTWASEVEVQALAYLLNIPIYVYAKYGDEWKWLKYSPLRSSGDHNSNKGIYVRHTNSNHFDTVVSVYDAMTEDISYMVPAGKYIFFLAIL